MKTKLFEIRDRMTFIPCIAIQLSLYWDIDVHHKAERYLLARAGFGATRNLPHYVLFGRLDDGVLRWDLNAWPASPRTLPAAHKYIHEHWSELSSGDVIDVEFILGEASAPKQSERIDEIADAAADALGDAAFER